MNGRPHDPQGDGHAWASFSDEDLAAALLDGGLPPQREDPERGSIDEWLAVALTARSFVPERPAFLGGPQERVTAGMAARTVTLRRRTVVGETADTAIPRAPSEEERARTARRTTEAQPERDSPAMVLVGLFLLIGLFTFLVFLFGARLFG